MQTCPLTAATDERMMGSMRGFVRGCAWVLALAPAVRGAAATTSYVDPAAFGAALPPLQRTLDAEALSVGTLLPSGTSAWAIRFSYDLDGELLQVIDRFDTVSPSRSLGLTGADDALLDGDPLALAFTKPVLAIGVFVITSDPAAANEILLVTPQGVTGNASGPIGVLADGGRVYFLGLVSGTAFSSASLSFAGDGGIHFVYNLDDLITAVAEADALMLAGTAVGGFPIDFSVAGVALQVTTLVGQTAAEVAQAIAELINSDPTLLDAGVIATAQDGTVLSNGIFADVVIGDPGLGTRPIPTLVAWGMALLMLLLLGAAARALHSEERP